MHLTPAAAAPCCCSTHTLQPLPPLPALLLRYLLEDVAIEQLAEAMYKAPFGCIVDETGAADVSDPLVVYANRGVLQLLELKWPEVVDCSAAGAYKLEQQVGGAGAGAGAGPGGGGRGGLL